MRFLSFVFGFAFSTLLHQSKVCLGSGTNNSILHITVDDLGYFDLGYKNGITRSPTIDDLVARGVRLSSYYVMVVCSPTRSSMLTGRYPWRQGFYSTGGSIQALNASFKLLPSVLKEQGNYATVAIGKWHLGYYKKMYTPTLRGFDQFMGYYNAAMYSYWYHGEQDSSCLNGFSTDLSNNTGLEIKGSDAHLVNGTYSTKAFQDYAIEWLTKHYTASRTQPFYMYLAQEAVHDAGKSGIQAPLETVKTYEDVILSDTYRVTAAAITELDRSIANITRVIRDNNGFDNLVIIIVTDKEGGVRGEAIIFSELIPLSARGKAFNGLAHACDIYSTIISGIAGLDIPEDTGPVPMDSHNLWQSILDPEGTPGTRTDVIIQAALPSLYNTTQAIRVGRLKLILGRPGDNRIRALPPKPVTHVPFGKSGGIVESGTDHATGIDFGAKPSEGSNCEDGCLFDVVADVNESTDLSNIPAYAQYVASMKMKLAAEAANAMPPASAFEPDASQKEIQDIMNRIAAVCARTGYVQPGDLIAPVPPAPPSPSPPNPGNQCKKALSQTCPFSKFKGNYEKCLLTCREHRPQVCTSQEIKAYCQGK
eukprot:UC4_evm3s1277